VCRWGAHAALYADNTSLDTAFGTWVYVDDTGLGVNTHHQSDATAAITPSGTAAAGRPCIVEICREAVNGGDTLSADAALMGILLTKVS